MESVHSRPTFTITDDLNEDRELNSDATVNYEWEEEEDEEERNTKIQELMQRIRSWVRLPRNDNKTANEALALAAISAPIVTTPTSALATPTSPTPSVLTYSPVDTPRLAVATPTLETSLASTELQVAASAAASLAEPNAGDVNESVVVLDLELAEDKGSLTALSAAETASRSSIDCATDVTPAIVGTQQATNACEAVTAAATTTTSTPTSQHSNGNAHAGEHSNTNGNNNSCGPPANTCSNSGNTKCVTPTQLAKAANHQSNGRNHYNNKAKVTLKMRFKVAKRICQRRIRAKNIDENFPQPHEVTEGALQVWRALPERIRQDPSLASFRMEHERLHGDLDPLPSPDVPEHYVKSPNAFTKVGINVTNELGQVRILEVRDMENNNEDHHDDHDEPHSRRKKFLKWLKISILLVVWAVFTAFLMSNNEHVDELRLISVPKSGEEKLFPVTTATLSRLGLKLKGPFRQQEADPFGKNKSSFAAPPTLHVQLQRKYYNASGDEFYVEDASKVWKLSLVYPEQLDTVKESWKANNYDISPADEELLLQANYTTLNLRFVANIESEFPLQLSIDESPIYKKEGVIYAAIVLCGLYIMIIWEIVNRTFAAMIASTLSVGILAALNSRPSMATIMGWIDVETLLLLFGMMILVAILSETGIFDYLAVYAYKITNGHIWPLINCLCLFTAVLSSFLDNVTTVLLMTPVTIRLCEVMALNPVPILMCMVIYSNIGGALTPVGDPPNVIIASNNFISRNGVNFAIFTLHMLPGVILVMLQTYVQLRLKFRNTNDLQFKDSPEVEEMRHEIHVWKRAAQSLSAYSKDEEIVRQTLMKKVNRLKRSLKKRVSEADAPAPNYKQTLTQLQAKYPIRNKALLIKCSFALVFVISLFFLHSVPELQRLSLGWTALLGAIFLLILADIEDMEAILARVEWSTLLFFAALFILMEALSELGLIEWIGQMTESIILGVSEGSRLMVAVLIILWVSAITSAFVDNIPLTTMMVKITISLAENSALNLPLQPLVWALALGACLGGNGTLIGASANVVCAGVAEQHGYKFTFLEFFKVGFPVMIGSIIVSTAYLLFTHVLFAWH